MMMFRGILAISIALFLVMIGGIGTVLKVAHSPTTTNASISTPPIQQPVADLPNQHPVVPQSAPVTASVGPMPLPSSGSVAMNDGVRSLSVYGHIMVLTFDQADQGKTLVATAHSQLPIRLELWQGEIKPGDQMWWGNGRKQVMTSNGSGTNFQDSPSPVLTWQIEPGAYTLLFCRASRDQSNFDVRYEISKNDSVASKTLVQAPSAQPPTTPTQTITPSLPAKVDTPRPPQDVAAADSNQNLRAMSLTDLKRLRNEPYAKHGYKFKSPDLLSYFSQKAWYKPTKTDEQKVWNELTPDEKVLITRVKEEEKRRSH